MKKLIESLESLKTKSSMTAVLKEFPQVIVNVDSAGKFLEFFSEDNERMGMSSASPVRNLADFFPPHLSGQVSTYLAKALQTQAAVPFEYSVSNSGNEKYFEAKLIPNSNKGVFALIREVTSQRLAQIKEAEHNRLIRESEERFRLLADNLPGAVYLCSNDADFSMLYLNEKIFEITGYEPAKFISKEINFPEIYHPDDTPEIYRQVEESLAAKKSFHLEYRIQHKSGILKWIEEFGTGVYNSNGELLCLEGYLQDISNRKNAEMKIKEQNDALTKTNEELDRFVYSASHDLRSPLSSLLGLIHLAETSDAVSESKQLLEKMKDCVNNLDYFIREIAHYSQNSRLEVEAKEVSVHGIVGECIDSLRHMEEAKGISFDVQVPADTHWLSDVRRLKIILNNLVANAIKYSDSSKPERWIKIKCDTFNDEYTLCVEDNGIGIEEQYQPKIFNMFFRASEKSNGSGLGLYIVNETVSKLGGHIHFHSRQGEGTSFQINLSGK